MTSNGSVGMGAFLLRHLNLTLSSSLDQQKTSRCSIKIVMFPKVYMSLYELKIIYVLMSLREPRCNWTGLDFKVHRISKHSELAQYIFSIFDLRLLSSHFSHTHLSRAEPCKWETLLYRKIQFLSFWLITTKWWFPSRYFSSLP